ncbi:hypothetical protein Dimus_014202 [Dionaea muscipula]
MMQLHTETPPPPALHQSISFSSNMSMNSSIQIYRSRPWHGGFPSSSKSSLLYSFGDANCMEQLLIHCANAIENNDATLSQQILWVLNNVAPPDGDSSQRLTWAFLRALIVRAASTGTCKLLTAMATAQDYSSLALHTHRFSVLELANFVHLTPWHRFGFSAANAAILEAAEGHSAIHIVDFSSTHCMQIPTLIDAMANRLEGPPIIKLTVAGLTEEVPPMLDIFSYDEVGSKLVNFARTRNISLEFRVVPCSSSDGFRHFIEHLTVHQQQQRHQQQQLLCPNGCEALFINCQMVLHLIPDETLYPCPPGSSYPPYKSPRTRFLEGIRGLNPTMAVLVDEDVDFTASDLVCRLRSALDYLWIPFDTVDTFLAKGSKQREWYEADICWKIENVVAEEGLGRVERQERRGRWGERMREAGFRGVAMGEAAAAEVKSMVEEHAGGWGSKKDDDDLVLTWKGHDVAFAAAWVPAA